MKNIKKKGVRPTTRNASLVICRETNAFQTENKQISGGLDRPSSIRDGNSAAPSASAEQMKQAARRPWLQADDDLLRSLALLGLSEGEIAEKIDRSKPSIRSRAKKNEIAIARDWNGNKKIAASAQRGRSSDR